MEQGRRERRLAPRYSTNEERLADVAREIDRAVETKRTGQPPASDGQLAELKKRRIRFELPITCVEADDLLHDGAATKSTLNVLSRTGWSDYALRNLSRTEAEDEAEGARADLEEFRDFKSGYVEDIAFNIEDEQLSKRPSAEQKKRIFELAEANEEYDLLTLVYWSCPELLTDWGRRTVGAAAESPGGKGGCVVLFALGALASAALAYGVR